VGVDTDESRHKHRGWAQTTKAEWTQTDLTQTVRHLGTKDRGQKDRRVERHTVAERSRVDRKTQLDKHTVYTNKEIGHKHKQGHIQNKKKKSASRCKQRDSRTNRVIEWAQEAEWAQTPTSADTNTLKVCTSNTNRDTNRVTVESLPWSS